MKYVVVLAFSIILVIVYELWKNGGLDPNKTKINDEVYLVKENNSYSIYCEQKKTQILVSSKVDSVIVSYKYGTLLHGLNNSKNKFEWIYIDVSDVKNVHYGFTNVFEATSSTMGESYVDSVLTSSEIGKNIMNKLT